MVDKVYIVWCKLNKSTDKFDLGVFIDKQEAEDTVGNYMPQSKPHTQYKVWVQEYRLA